ncbi:hypothetical protein [Methylosinus sp. R-45379]|jgi:hypothetical protein|nr:hypothetical protein [Methylosinus sp. R-45379]
MLVLYFVFLHLMRDKASHRRQPTPTLFETQCGMCARDKISQAGEKEA